MILAMWACFDKTDREKGFYVSCFLNSASKSKFLSVGLATSDAGKPQSQRLAPLNHPQGRIPTRMPGAWWIQGEIPLLEPPKGIEKKIFKIK